MLMASASGATPSSSVHTGQLGFGHAFNYADNPSQGMPLLHSLLAGVASHQGGRSSNHPGSGYLGEAGGRAGRHMHACTMHMHAHTRAHTHPTRDQ